VIVIDTSALIGSLCGAKHSAAKLRRLIEDGNRIVVPTLVLYEWLRGPRNADELALQEEILPSAAAPNFGLAEALVSAQIYRSIRRPRGREIDIAIAAHAIVRNAALWTLNTADFEDIAGLHLELPV